MNEATVRDVKSQSFEAGLRAGIRLASAFGQDIHPLIFDPKAAEQVLTNLLSLFMSKDAVAKQSGSAHKTAAADNISSEVEFKQTSAGSTRQSRLLYPDETFQAAQTDNMLDTPISRQAVVRDSTSPLPVDAKTPSEQFIQAANFDFNPNTGAEADTVEIATPLSYYCGATTADQLTNEVGCMITNVS